MTKQKKARRKKVKAARSRDCLRPDDATPADLRAWVERVRSGECPPPIEVEGGGKYPELRVGKPAPKGATQGEAAATRAGALAAQANSSIGLKGSLGINKQSVAAIQLSNGGVIVSGMYLPLGNSLPGLGHLNQKGLLPRINGCACVLQTPNGVSLAIFCDRHPSVIQQNGFGSL